MKRIYYYRKSLEYSKKNHDTTQMVLTKLNIAWAYFDIAILIKDYPISILSINTIQNLAMNQLSLL
jgi:hypothetical protein